LIALCVSARTSGIKKNADNPRITAVHRHQKDVSMKRLKENNHGGKTNVRSLREGRDRVPVNGGRF
jgi:hypothetical protein